MECDAIIMDDAKIFAIPGLIANNIDAALIHRGCHRQIAGEQIVKLMTLGLYTRKRRKPRLSTAS